MTSRRMMCVAIITSMVGLLFVCAHRCGAQEPLILTKSDNIIGCVERGDSIYYTVVCENPNPYLIFDNFAIRDVLPHYTNFIDATGGGIYDSVTRSVSWEFSVMDSAEVRVLSLIVQVDSAAVPGGGLVDTCLAFGDSVITDTTAVAESTLVCSPVYLPLELSKEDGLDHCVGFDYNITYRIAFMNPNPDQVSSVVVTDGLPQEVEYQFSTGGGGYDAGSHTVTWQLDSLGAFASDTVFVTVMVGESVTPGGSIIDTCMITSAETGFTLAADTTEVCGEAPPECLVDPATLDFGTVTLGSFADLTFTITNMGGDTLSGEVSESCTDFSLFSGGGPYDLGAGESIVVVVRFEPMAEGLSACTIATGTECANVSCSGAGVLPPICNVAPNLLDFGSVTVGGYADLTFTISNVGGGTLTGTVSEACADLAITAGGGAFSLGAGEFKDVTVTFSPTVAGSAACTVETGAECANIVCTGTGTPVVGPLTLVKRDNVATCTEPGDTVTYSLIYSNPNLTPVGPVMILERIPVELNFISAGGGGAYNPSTRLATWDLDTLAAGVTDSVSLLLEIDLSAPEGSTVTDSAFIAWGSTFDYATETTQICGPFLALTLSKDDNLGGEPAVPGQLINYTIRYGNPNMLKQVAPGRTEGPSLLMRPDRPATNVILSDQIPDETDFEYLTGPGVYDPVARLVTWSLGTLPSGASDSVNLGVRVMASTAPGTYVTNRCWITCDQTGPTYVEATETTLIVEAPIPTNMNIDIKPGGCPNPLNPKSMGVIPAAILGTADLDVRDIDTATIRIRRGGEDGEVAPLRWAYEDVGTPYSGEPCGCNDLGRDGWMDLTLKFDTQAVMAALSMDDVRGETVPVEIIANLADGALLVGSDCVRVLDSGNSRERKTPENGGFVPSGTILSRTGSDIVVSFYMENAGPVRLDIYDVRGQAVRRLEDDVVGPGMHTVVWDGYDSGGRRINTGVYFARLHLGTDARTKKILVLK